MTQKCLMVPLMANEIVDLKTLWAEVDRWDMLRKQAMRKTWSGEVEGPNAYLVEVSGESVTLEHLDLAIKHLSNLGEVFSERSRDEDLELESFLDDYSRVDTKTGFHIIEGWVFESGEAYFALESDAEAYALETYGKSISQIFEEEGDETLKVYWTYWCDWDDYS